MKHFLQALCAFFNPSIKGRTESEAYLAQATDLCDLENRMRNLDRGMFHPALLEGHRSLPVQWVVPR